MRLSLLFGSLVFAASVLAQDPAPPVIDALDLETLRNSVGQEVIVKGPVTSVGTTSTKSITFINVGLPKKQGFVAVIFQRNYGEFPEGFDSYKNQMVRVSGTVTLYQNETPQIEVRSPEQIQIVTESE